MTTKKKPSKPATKAKRKEKSVQFLQKPTCTTCRKARAYMENRGFDLHSRNLDKERLSSDELEELIGDRDHRDFLNTRNELYRRKKMKQNPPTRAEAIRMMLAEPNLIRRPVIVAGGRVVLGYDREKIDHLLPHT
jgi:Spx/MgsR family transcriptional regulator